MRPFDDYVVNPDWILALLAAGKIACREARRLCVRCAKHVPQLMANIDQYDRMLREEDLERHICSVQRAVRRNMRPFKTLPAVVAWLRQFEEILPRHSFLVLHGPSLCA